jgi:hypothetical protein
MAEAGQESSQQSNAAPKPTVAALIYLHADRLITNHGFLRGCSPVPCSDNKVPTEDLVVLLFASALWSLRRQGLVALDAVPAEGNGGLLHAHHLGSVVVTPLASAERSGLEGAILRNLQGSEPITEVICRWSEPLSADPWHDVLEAAIDEAIDAGYLASVTPNGGAIARLLRGDRELTADCGRIESSQGAFEELAGAWRRFQADESELYHELSAECRRALVACTERWYA